MGKKGSWFSIVKKALSNDLKEKKEKKQKKRWFGKQKSLDEDILVAEKPNDNVVDSTSSLPHPPPALKVVTFKEPDEDEQKKLANTVVSATAMAAEAATAMVFRFLHHPAGKSTEEIAAIKIQAVLRGYLERKASRAWRGLVRLRLLIRGKSVQRQVNSTLRCMQTLARVQTQIRSRRIRLSKENQALQKQLQQKREKDFEVQQKRDKDIEKFRASMGDNWENSAQSKEQVEANQHYKQEAAIRRERALAYAYSQQQTRNIPSKNTNQAWMDPTTPSWGWSWLERWMSARPIEAKGGSEKDANSEYSPSAMSTPSRAISVGKLSRANSCGDLNLDLNPSLSTTTSPKKSQGRLSFSDLNFDIKLSSSSTISPKKIHGKLCSSDMNLNSKPSTSTTASPKRSPGRLSSNDINLDSKLFTSTTNSPKMSQGRLSSSDINLDSKLSTSTTNSPKMSQGRLSSSDINLDSKLSTSTTNSPKMSQGRLSSSDINLDSKLSTSTTNSPKMSQGRLSSSDINLDNKLSTSTTNSPKMSQGRLSSSVINLDGKLSTSTTNSPKMSQGRLSSSDINLDSKLYTSTTNSPKMSQGRLSSSDINLDSKLSTCTTNSPKKNQGRLSSSDINVDSKLSTSTTNSPKISQGRLSSNGINLDSKLSTSTTNSPKKSQGRPSSGDINLDIKPSTSNTSSPKQILTRSRPTTRPSLSFPHSKIAPVSPVTGPVTTKPKSRRAISFGGDGDLNNPINERNKRQILTESALSDGESPVTPTRTPRSKTTRMPSPLGFKSGGGGASFVADKPNGSLRKRISSSGSSSGHQRKISGGSLKDIRVDA